MDFTFNDEQRSLQESAQSFFADNASSEVIRRAMASEVGFDQAIWQRLINEMGWNGIAVPESYGGLGLGFVEIAIVQQEMGRCLYASPFFSTSCLAIPAILAAGTATQCENLLPALASGRQTATLACANDQGKVGIDTIAAMLLPKGDGNFSLTGSASFVVFGHSADLLIIAARTLGRTGPDSVSLIALPRNTAGIQIEKLNGLDLTRPYARIAFDQVEVPTAAVLGAVGGGADALLRALALGNIALAAEQTGGAEKCLAFTVEYAKQREQFGRAIGSFQAIKHKLADMMVLIEAAKSATYYAACTVDENPEQLFEAAALAKAYCADAYFQCAGQAIQIHGGIGYTWEHDAHLYFKRARASMNLLGDCRTQREFLAEQLFNGELTLLGRAEEASI